MAVTRQEGGYCHGLMSYISGRRVRVCLSNDYGQRNQTEGKTEHLDDRQIISARRNREMGTWPKIRKWLAYLHTEADVLSAARALAGRAGRAGGGLLAGVVGVHVLGGGHLAGAGGRRGGC